MENSISPLQAPVIMLGEMPQQRRIRTADEDWTGITSSIRRRKLQNRLNQRAYEQRKVSRSNPTLPPMQGSQQGRSCQSILGTVGAPEGLPHAQESAILLVPAGYTQNSKCMLLRPGTQSALRQFARKAYEDYILGFPQSWYLSTLIQVNVLDALTRNGFALGFSYTWQSHDATSPFGTFGPGDAYDSAPPSLQPTVLQRTVPHHPWIDLFPFPQLRDNILRWSDRIDMEELCKDLVDIKPGLEQKPNLIVWGEPWDGRGWEASLGFLEKWGWITRGCPDILQASNYWRQRRGESEISSAMFSDAADVMWWDIYV